jgi:Secretion system C-terminal sorting domain
LACCSAQAQQVKDSTQLKFGMQWAVGFTPMLRFNFNNSPVFIDTLRSTLEPQPWCGIISDGSTISDSQGNLALVSDPYVLYDGAGYGFNNWKGVNCAKGTKFAYALGGNFTQMVLNLPLSKNRYYVFTTGMSDSAFEDAYEITKRYDRLRCDLLSYHIVDLDSNNGKGKVISKNNLLLDKQWLALDRMTAVQHANGRDWWLIKAARHEHKFYTFYVNEYGVQLWDSTLQNADSIEFGRYGQLTASPDGTMLAMVNHSYDKKAYVYDFDRCLGKPAFRKTFYYNSDTSNYYLNGGCGVCFNASSQLLYVAANYQIFQVDLLATDTSAVKLVAGPDDTAALYPYNNIALAPDHRIYIGNSNARQTMSYIDSPDVIGTGCKFVPKGISTLHLLPQHQTYMTRQPNMPHFGIGKIAGSPCDTIIKVLPKPPVPIPQVWTLYPNPVHSMLHIAVPDSTVKSIELRVISLTGQTVLNTTAGVQADYTAGINVEALAKGLYVMQVVRDRRVVFVAKFVKE